MDTQNNTYTEFDPWLGKTVTRKHRPEAVVVESVVCVTGMANAAKITCEAPKVTASADENFNPWLHDTTGQDAWKKLIPIAKIVGSALLTATEIAATVAAEIINDDAPSTKEESAADEHLAAYFICVAERGEDYARDIYGYL